MTIVQFTFRGETYEAVRLGKEWTATKNGQRITKRVWDQRDGEPPAKGVDRRPYPFQDAVVEALDG